MTTAATPVYALTTILPCARPSDGLSDARAGRGDLASAQEFLPVPGLSSKLS